RRQLVEIGGWGLGVGGCGRRATGERVALGPLLGCAAVLAAFGVRLGMQPATAALFVLLYLAFALTVTRLRAQVGVPFHDLHGVNPVTVLLNTRGTEGMTAGDLVGFTSYWFFNRTYRSSPMPPMLEGMQGAAVAS